MKNGRIKLTKVNWCLWRYFPTIIYWQWSPFFIKALIVTILPVAIFSSSFNSYYFSWYVQAAICLRYCLSCQSIFTISNSLMIDHIHKTGKQRSWDLSPLSESPQPMPYATNLYHKYAQNLWATHKTFRCEFQSSWPKFQLYIFFSLFCFVFHRYIHIPQSLGHNSIQ